MGQNIHQVIADHGEGWQGESDALHHQQGSCSCESKLERSIVLGHVSTKGWNWGTTYHNMQSSHLFY